MTYYAKVLDGKVVKVIVAESNFFDTFVEDSPGTWIETSYDTSKNVHKTGGTPLRKNFAGIGFEYRKDIDAFIPKKPFDSWILDEDKGRWEAPKARPSDKHDWDESLKDWVINN